MKGHSGTFRDALLAALADRNPESVGGPQETATGADPGTALMLSPRVLGSRRLVAEAIAIMAPSLGLRPDRALDEMQKRIYRDADGRATIEPITWAVTSHGDGASVESSCRVEIGGVQRTVRVVPFFCGLDIQTPYAVCEHKGRWRSNGSWLCLLVKPHANVKNQDLWHAFPLGLCPLRELKVFNQLSAGMGQPQISVVENTLTRLGSRRFSWTPSAKEYQPPDESHRHATLGFHRGKRVVWTGKGQVPPHKTNENGEVISFEEGVFEYVERPTRIEVTYLGKPGTVPLYEEAPTLDERVTINPYDVIGRTALELNPDRLEDLRRHLEKTLMSPTNPAVLYARARGLVRPGDNADRIRVQTMPLIARAMEMIAEGMEADWNLLIEATMAVRNLLVLEEILEGKGMAEVRRKCAGSDVLADRIAEAIVGKSLGRTFWRYPMLVKLRTYLFDEIVKRSASPDDLPPEAT